MLRQQEINQFKSEGFLLRDLFESVEVKALREAIEEIESEGPRDDAALTFEGPYLTEIYDVPRRKGLLSRLVRHPRLLEIVMDLLAEPVAISAGLMLDKLEMNNWEVGWHQDTSVYSADIPPDLPGEIRGGIPTFRPLDNTMSSCVTARIAIDMASIEHGNLFLLPGTHRKNLWPDGGKDFLGLTGTGCIQTPGSVLFFCPLIIHRAEKNRCIGSRRRVLHLTYRPASLRLPQSDWFHWPHPRPLTALSSLWADN